MDENNNMDAPVVPETPEVEVDNPETPQEPENPDETEVDPEKEELRRKLEESESKRKQLFERLQKKETPETPGLTATDAILISRANIDVEDVERVVKFAKDEGITIKEALANNELKAILAVRSEERTTAAVTHTRSPRGVTKQTGEDLLRRAEKTGEVPETDDGMRNLAEARMARAKARRHR